MATRPTSPSMAAPCNRARSGGAPATSSGSCSATDNAVRDEDGGRAAAVAAAARANCDDVEGMLAGLDGRVLRVAVRRLVRAHLDECLAVAEDLVSVDHAVRRSPAHGDGELVRSGLEPERHARRG